MPTWLLSGARERDTTSVRRWRMFCRDISRTFTAFPKREAKGGAMTEIYVDADACPVKDEVLRVAARHGLGVFMVTDGGIRPFSDPSVKLVIVPQGADAADDWIAERITDTDICVTNDIPLAARCLERGALAIKPNGETFREASIGVALANRALMQSLRESGEITGGPRAFSKADRSAFLDRLEHVVREAIRR